jgi:hypothetical protein
MANVVQITKPLARICIASSPPSFTNDPQPNQSTLSEFPTQPVLNAESSKFLMLNECNRAWCTKLLTNLIEWSISSPFRMPVDPIRDGVHEYATTAKKPHGLLHDEEETLSI